MRESRQPQTEGSVSRRTRASSRRTGTRRRLWAGSLALILPLVLVLTALLAPIGQAHPARERTPEEESARAQAKLVAAEERAAERKAEHEVKAGGRGDERVNGLVLISCTQVSWTFKNFPALPGNTVTEKLRIGHLPATLRTFSFDGSTGTDVVAIEAPPGVDGHAYQIDAWGKWTTNGVRGAFDIHSKVKCAPTPALSIEKFQKIEGSGGAYTSSPLSGKAGQTVDYEILVKNTGNVPLSLGSFSDPRCDAGTVSGGPGGEELAVGASATYLCRHLLGTADQTAGSYSNTVSLTATPPAGEGSPVSQTSNTVVVEVTPTTPPGNEDKTPSTTSGTTPVTPAPTTPASSTLANTVTQLPRSGVLAFSSASIPHLSAPQGCLRTSFHASVKSAGVASVTFYLDGHRLRRMTAHRAKRGLLTITINPAGWSVGAHRLLARITMIKAPGAAKAVTASRSRTLLRCQSVALTPKFTG